MRVIIRHYARISNLPFYKEHCFYLIPMMGWFVSSAALSAYNKYVFGESGKVAFPCPLLLTSIHFLSQWVFSTSICAIFPQATGLPRIQQMNWTEFWSVSIPCGMVTAADVGLSNLSMVYISLTFYTMVKASTPIFVLFWAWLFQIERITWSLMGVVAVIAVGEFLTVQGEAHFVLQGFCYCLAASVLSGARWTLVQLKLQTLEPPLKTSLATMRVLAPSMFVSLFLTALCIERPWEHLRWQEAGYVVALGGLGGTAAIAMTLCEFWLIMEASAIVLMIGGVVKEILNIAIGMAFFGDTLNAINTLGFCIVFGGVILYKFTFHGSGSTASRTVEQAPVPVVEHYGLLTSSDEDESSSLPPATDLTIHSKTSNDDVALDRQPLVVGRSGGNSDEEHYQQNQQGDASLLRRRGDTSSEDDIVLVSSSRSSDPSSDHVEIPEGSLS